MVDINVIPKELTAELRDFLERGYLSPQEMWKYLDRSTIQRGIVHGRKVWICKEYGEDGRWFESDAMGMKYKLVEDQDSVLPIGNDVNFEDET